MHKDATQKHVVDKYQLAQFILAFIAIIVSFGTAYKVIDYQMNEQTKFDKHVAAKQFELEIESINQPIESYFNFYANCRDLTSNGEPINLNKDVLYNILVADKANDVIPQAIIIDDMNMKPAPLLFIPPIYKKGTFDYDWNIYFMLVSNYNNGKNYTSSKVVNVTATVDNPLIPSPLYNEHGMYYVYQKDLYNFNASLAQDLYIFYMYLTTAEIERQHMQECFDNSSYPFILTQNDFKSYMTMRSCILASRTYSKQILQELKKEENS
jgi:hypothetical protein